MTKIIANGLRAFLKLKKLQLETGGNGGRTLREVASKTVPDCLGCVETNGELSNTFSQRICEKTNNLLVYCEPFVMVRIENSFGRFNFGGSRHDGGRWFGDGTIDIAPKLLTMKIRFDLAKPS